MDEMLLKARALAEKAHAGQIDKAGQPYYLHPFAVSDSCTSVYAKAAALLHDVPEDTNITERQLRGLFPGNVVDAVVLLTHDPSENYYDYVYRVKQNPIAREVKTADLMQNGNLTRLKTVTLKDAIRAEKYAKALQILLS